MNEEFNIEKLEALLRKAQVTALNEEELKFLEENGIDPDTIAFMVQATSPETEVEFLNASHVKSKVLEHFNPNAPQTKAETPSETPTRKIFDFKPLLKYAAIFIVSMGALATTYFIINFEKINSDNVAINEPTPKHTLEEITLSSGLNNEDSIDDFSKNVETPENKLILPPPPPSAPVINDELFKAEIETETKPIGLVNENNADLNLEYYKQNEVSNDTEIGKSALSNTIVVSEKRLDKSEESRVLREESAKKAAGISPKNNISSQDVGPYIGGMAQLKIDLKKEIKSSKKYADNSHVTVNVIPTGDGTLKDVEIISTNDAQFAADVVAALKRLKNWEIGNTRKQNYLFFSLDFN